MGREGLERVFGEFGTELDARGFEGELIGLEAIGTAVFGEKLHGVFPGDCALRWCFGSRLDLDLTARFDDQFFVRFLNGEEVVQVSEVVDAFGEGGGYGFDFKFADSDLLIG